MTKIKSYVHDAGRIGDGFETENNDCAVRAYAISHEIPYYEAHERFKEAGRRNGRGVALKQIISVLGSAEYRVGGSYGLTLTAFLAIIDTGTYMVVNRNHAFCIKNKVVFDHRRHTGKTKVYGYWKVK